MKFGVLLLFRGSSTTPDTAQIYEQAMVEALAAERLGFDTCYVPEHHLALDGTMPRALVYCSAILACTRRLTVGTAVLQLNVHHPLELAEECYVLDNLSRGRFTLGVGLTSIPEALRAFGADPSRHVSRFEEIIEIVREGARGKAFSHQGKHFQFNDLRITPSPYTPNGPPVWIGARAPGALERAGRIADGWISDPMHSMDVMKHSTDMYRASAAANGRSSYVALIRDTWVAPTREEVHTVWWPHVKQYHGYYKFLFDLEREPKLRPLHTAQEWTFERIAPERLLCGTPEDIISEIRRYQAVVGCDEIIFSFRYSTGPEPADCLKMLELLGREVLPVLRKS